MDSGFKLQDGGRIDVVTDKGKRRVRLTLAPDLHQADAEDTYTLTLSEARGVASALMGAAAEA